MKHNPGEKWNQRFASATKPGNPAYVLTANVHLLPGRGRALDLACGLGANALLLAREGLQVDALDASSVALAKLADYAAREQLPIVTHRCDLEHNWQAEQRYDVIVCSHYLHRPLCPRLQDALCSGGLLYYQTFTRDKISPEGPASAEYLLAKGELADLFKYLQLVFYREDWRYGDLSQGQRNVACLVGAKP